MPLTTEAVPIDRIVGPLAPFAGKLDGPLTKLLRGDSTPPPKELQLMVRCEEQSLPAARELIRGRLNGSIVKEVPWVDRGSYVHVVLAYEKIPALAADPNVFKVGLLQTFITKR